MNMDLSTYLHPEIIGYRKINAQAIFGYIYRPDSYQAAGKIEDLEQD